MNYEINGYHLNVIEKGEGQLALVFLHYWGGSSRTWSQVIRKLEHGFYCIAYDQKGAGLSEAPATGYTLEESAKDVITLIHQLGLTDYVLIGHSMGAKIVQLVASTQPRGLLAIILVGPAPPSPLILPEPLRTMVVHAYDNEENIRKTIEQLTLIPLSMDIQKLIVEDSLRVSEGLKKAWPDEISHQDISDAVTRIRVPCLVIGGINDPEDPEKHNKRELVTKIKGAQLALVPAVGHLLPLEAPEVLADHIRSFLFGMLDPAFFRKISASRDGQSDMLTIL